MASINCIDRRFCTAKDIRYQKVVAPITREYVSVKSMPGFCVKPCAMSLALYLTTSLFSFRFWRKTHLNPTGKTLGGVGIASVNTFLLLSEAISACVLPFRPVGALLALNDGPWIMISEKGICNLFSKIYVDSCSLTVK